ncbi:cytochrome-c peroxidase [Persicobacter diffluens]|uniref:Cytochrome b6 n=1 Tax=Persicobacter diffluens TaxID=981 RepID=A0AAN4W038_9BACT|nr:cytochrome b6 [Persicobacter diffluens]
MRKQILVLGLVAAGMVICPVVNASQDSEGVLKLSKQVKTIFNNRGCMDCHASDAELPFYGELPVIGNMVKEDMENAQNHFNLSEVMNQLEKGQQVNEVDLAKIEKSTADNTMPPTQYAMVHWGSSLSADDKAVIADWAKVSRATFYANGTAAAEFANEPVQPIKARQDYNEEKVALGNKLYHDTRLSGDNTVSCASCHDLNTGGVDRLKFSKGINGQVGDINAPTVFNARYNHLQFWDGRAEDLQAQAGGPPMNPIEMGSTNWEEITGKLNEDVELTREFLKVYPQGFSGETITDAIAEFEKTLATPNSPFDRYLKGDKTALTSAEVEGYNLFKQYNCATCHVGEAMGGQSFEKMGLKANYFADRGEMITPDYGRMNATGLEKDIHRFKTPTLRNVELTAPYMHDGSVETLEEATRLMLKYQSGVNASEEEVKLIANFLRTLNGEYGGKPLSLNNL